MQQEVTILEIDWSETVAPVSLVGSPYLFGWFRAAYVRPGLISDGQVIVVARADPAANWEQYQGPVSLPEADTLVCMFAGLGVPERAPRVESVYDSSDTWTTSSVRVVVGDRTQAFTIQTQCGGFQGPDADGLRDVFRRILGLSGYGQRRTIFGDSARNISEHAE